MDNILYILLLAITSVYCDESDLLIRKCCPEIQYFDWMNRTCVDYLSNETTITKDTKTVEEVRTNDSLHFPWWMDSTIHPFSSDTMREMLSFLAEQNISKYIEFGVRPNCKFTDNFMFLTNNNRLKLLSNGSLLYDAQDQGYPEFYTFSPTSYCTDSLLDGSFLYLICSCLETMCIKKCCALNAMRTVEVTKESIVWDCKKTNTGVEKLPSHPTFHISKTPTAHAPQYVLFNNDLTCNNDSYEVFLTKSVSNFWIDTNGSVLIENYGDHIPYPRDQYCWDTVYNEQEDSVTEVLKVCVLKRSHQGVYYIVISLFSSIFFILTLVVLAIAPAARKKNTKIVVCHIVSLLLVYMVFVAGQVRMVLPPLECQITPFFIQFLFHCAFFWLNVMCIDISWTFSNPMKSYLSSGGRAFLFYSLYAWGGPVIISAVTALMEFAPFVSDDFIKPKFGTSSCWFIDNTAVWAYFYGPIAFLLVMNLLLFALTATILLRKSSGFEKSSESRRHINKKEKKRFVLYVKLLCVMGVTWITEVVMWAVAKRTVLEYISDVVNALRAPLIFIILCCNRPVLEQVKQRLHSWRLLPQSCLFHEEKEATSGSSNSTQSSSVESLQMSQLESVCTDEKVQETGMSN